MSVALSGNDLTFPQLYDVALRGECQQITELWLIRRAKVDIERGRRGAPAYCRDDLALPPQGEPADMDRPARAQARQLLGKRLEVGSRQAIAGRHWPDAAGVDPGSRDVEDLAGWKIGPDGCAHGGFDTNQPRADRGGEGGTVGARGRFPRNRGITLD